MPESQRLVINTGPVIALVAALEDLTVLRTLYDEVYVPFEVCREIRAHGPDGFAAGAFEQAHWLAKGEQPLELAALLANSLDAGEAAVIQFALDHGIPTVAIDEAVGRRFAKLSGLRVTGSIGILLRARRQGISFSMEEAVAKMKHRGVWLSKTVVDYALAQASKSVG